MSVVTDLDADAFMRKYLEQPSDTTAHLVFADWLEERGEPHNRAWAYYIRLKAETDRYPADSGARHELDRQAGEYAIHIRARLTIPAKLFVGYPKSLLQLLPAPYLTVNLSRFTIPREKLYYLPESVARENLLFPLDIQGHTFLIAAAHPANYDTIQKLEFILNRDIVLVGAEPDDVQRAINREYGQTETEVVDSVFVEFVDTAIDFTPLGADDDPPVVRLVNMLLLEAVNRHPESVRLDPTPDALVVRHRVGGAWVDRDHIPRRLLRPVTERIAIMAGISVDRVFADSPAPIPLTGEIPFQMQSARFRVGVSVQPSADNPVTELVVNPTP